MKKIKCPQTSPYGDKHKQKGVMKVRTANEQCCVPWILYSVLIKWLSGNAVNGEPMPLNYIVRL